MASQHDTQPSHDSKFDPGRAPEERPEMWGWHAEAGKWARIAGVIVIALLLLMITTTSYNTAGDQAIITFAVVIGLILAWDRHRRRTGWRR